VSDMKAVYVGRNNENLNYGQTGEVLYQIHALNAFQADGASGPRAVSSNDLLFTSLWRPAAVNPHKENL
jgi:hypothetical protein